MKRHDKIPHAGRRTTDFGLRTKARHNPSSGFTYSEAEDYLNDRAVNPNVRYVPGESNRDELRVWETDPSEEQEYLRSRNNPDRGRHLSDGDIHDDVMGVLSRHPDIDSAQIEIDVRDGVVNLYGQVETRRLKRLIEDVLFGLPGIHDIQNRIEVLRPDRDRRRISRSLT